MGDDDNDDKIITLALKVFLLLKKRNDDDDDIYTMSGQFLNLHDDNLPNVYPHLTFLQASTFRLELKLLPRHLFMDTLSYSGRT